MRCVCLALFLSACGGDGSGVQGPEGADGLNSLIRTERVEPGAECAAGGVRVLSGLDANADGELGPDEVSGESFVCAGEGGEQGPGGQTPLIRTEDVAPGEDCAAGGVRVLSGLDANANAELDPDEVSAESLVCTGVEGLNSLIRTEEEPAGENCGYRGSAVSVGLDTNADGELGDDEIQETIYVCDTLFTDLAFPSPETLTYGSAGWAVPISAGQSRSFYALDHFLRHYFTVPTPHFVSSLSYRLEVYDDTYMSNCDGTAPAGGFDAVRDFEITIDGVRIHTFSFEGDHQGQTLTLEGSVDFEPFWLEDEHFVHIGPLDEVCVGGGTYRWETGGRFVFSG
ncbi:hypothetical protein DL240_04025 [Lujinxingia litoralis]|uniref:DUF7151 domain-containing protein n=2 Tax=Lujinxingia litoralis TaxID=2211119 RepID=A0A328CCE8_9DELT|nr:hypothetical protein DL240_04025 [Lujinxingia litoralis]